MENRTTRNLRNLCKYIHKALLPVLAEEFHIDYSELLKKRDTSDIWRQFAIWILVDPEYGFISYLKEKKIVVQLPTDGGGAVIPISNGCVGKYKKQIDEYNEIQQKKRIAIQNVAQLYIDDCKDMVACKVASDSAISVRNDSVLANCYTGNNELLTASALCALAASDDISTYRIKTVSVAASFSSDSDAHYERMANKLIELLQAAPFAEVNDEVQRHPNYRGTNLIKSISESDWDQYLRDTNYQP